MTTNFPLRPARAAVVEARTTLFDLTPQPLPDGRRSTCEGQTITVALVSCGKSKQDQPAPAKDLYTGDLFRKSRAYAEVIADRWYVLSAKHRLVHPDTVLEPYDMRMSDRPLWDRQHWGQYVDGSLRCMAADMTVPVWNEHDLGDRATISLGAWTMGAGHVKFVLLAGVDYREHLVPHLESWGAEVDVPMEGLTFGQQKAWLGRQVEDATPPSLP